MSDPFVINELKVNSTDIHDRAEAAEFWYSQYIKQNHGGKLPKSQSKKRAVIRRFSDIPQNKPEWLWEGHIPRGMLTIIAGDPGQGKSAVALDIAARVSSGKPFIHSLLSKEK